MSKNKSTAFFAVLFALTVAFSSNAIDVAHNKDFSRNLFVGLGANLGKSFVLGQLQTGLGFPIQHWRNSSLEVGPLVNILFGRVFGLDLDAFLKYSHRLNLAKTSPIKLYAKVPLGYSLLAMGKTVNHGFNVGIFPGISLDLNRHISFFAEAGYIHRFVSSQNLGVGAFNLGVIYNF